MRNSLLFSVALLGLAGCLTVQKDPPATTTYVTPAASHYDVCGSASTASQHYDHHSQSVERKPRCGSRARSLYRDIRAVCVASAAGLSAALRRPITASISLPARMSRALAGRQRPIDG